MRISDHLKSIDPVQLLEQYKQLMAREDAQAAARDADPAAYFKDEKREAILFDDLPQVAAFAGLLGKSAVEEGFSPQFAEGVFAGIIEFARALVENETLLEMDGLLGSPDPKPEG